MGECDRCHQWAQGPGFCSLDRCAVCGLYLCPDCMDAGCCYHRPAHSEFMFRVASREEIDPADWKDLYGGPYRS